MGQFLVVNVGKGKFSNNGIAAAMFDMASLTAPGWQTPMQTIGGGTLPGDLDMTILAAGIGDTVDGGVTMTTFLLKCCV
jgi:hypothetical protein